MAQPTHQAAIIKKKRDTLTFWFAIGGFALSLVNTLYLTYDEVVTKPDDKLIAEYQSFEAAVNNTLALQTQASVLDPGDPKNAMLLGSISAQMQQSQDVALNLGPLVSDKLNFFDALNMQGLEMAIGNYEQTKYYNDRAFALAPTEAYRMQTRWQRANIDAKFSVGADIVDNDFASALSFFHGASPTQVSLYVDWMRFALSQKSCDQANELYGKITAIEQAFPPTAQQSALIQASILTVYSQQRACSPPH